MQGYDYSSNSIYSVTLNTKDSKHLFGYIKDKKMHLNDLGHRAETCWSNIPNHFPDAILDEHIIMPNHIHGIIQIKHEPNRIGPIENYERKSLSSVIKGFKIGVTKWSRQNNKIQEVWHSSFFDRIIHSEEMLQNIRKYIRDNPRNWDIEKNGLF